MPQFKTTLEQWRILQEVADAGSYLQAADKLHRSHSSLNHAVTKLQRQLGVQLVESSGRKTRLTPIGEQLIRRARLILDETHAMESLAQTIEAGWESELTLAVDIQYPRDLLAKVLSEFASQSQGTWLSVVDVFLASAGKSIHEATADLVISQVLPEGFIGEPIYRVDMIPVARADHPIFVDRVGPVRARELESHLQITPLSPEATSTYKTGWQKSKQRWLVENFDAVLSLVRAGAGFAWLTLDNVQSHLKSGELRIIDLESGPGYKGFLYLIAPRAEELGPAGTRLKELIEANAMLEPAQFSGCPSVHG